MNRIVSIAIVTVALVATAPIVIAPVLAQTAASATSTAPVDVVKRFVEAINKNDAKAIKAMFAPNAYSAYGENGARKTGEALLNWLDSDIINVKGKINVTKETVQGNTVTIEGRYTSTGWSGNAKYVFTVQNGLISSWVLL